MQLRAKMTGVVGRAPAEIRKPSRVTSQHSARHKHKETAHGTRTGVASKRSSLVPHRAVLLPSFLSSCPPSLSVDVHELTITLRVYTQDPIFKKAPEGR